jgi:uncharacterized membrane protein
MTASKSSRARNARTGAQASAARNAARGGTAVKNGPATTTSGKAAGGATTRTGTSRNGNGGRNGTAARDARRAPARNGAAERGPRIAALPDSVATAGPAVWLQLTTFVLAVAGLGVSIYLTIAHFTESRLLGCSESGLVNCAKVTTSAQSYVFGIPVAVLGLAFFLFLVPVMSPWAWQAARREIHLARVAAMVAGIGMVLYLIYAELLIIGNICLYCTSVHIITFVLFVLTMIALATWGLKPGAAWKPGLPRRQPEG